ncbi:MAG: hypothetical protein EPN45_10065 [Rhizobiaceae bacterium]|nr:MAG: hypothetical protein EPN45_10065 [Rhizobiaceae bacterium]
MSIHGSWYFYIVVLACILVFDARIVSLRVKGIIKGRGRGNGDPSGFHEYVGLIHLHSEYSGDAQGSYAELARVAGEHKLDFMIVTDHNNTDAIRDGKEGIYDRTLVLTGVESTRPEGYLLGLGIADYRTARADPTETFLSEVAGQGGFAVMAHARNSHWPWKGSIDARMAGIEIVDFADQIYDASLASKAMAALSFPVNRLYAYLSLYHRPHSVIALWDAVSAQRPFVGIFASDIHQNLKIFKKRYKFPKAKDLMPFALNHLICPSKPSGDFQGDRETVYTAIRSGHLFMAVDLLGDARGFMFSARQDSGHGIMGDVLRAGEKTLFTVTLPDIECPRKLRVDVYRDGKKLFSRPARSFQFQSALPGAYRVEVAANIPNFWGSGREVTWIYSNPIHLF